LRRAREEYDSVFAASEGMVVTLGAPGEAVQAHLPGTRTGLRRLVRFQARVCGLTENGLGFVEETTISELSLQGALLSLKHPPKLQSELQITMEAPGPDGQQNIKLKGYVARVGTAPEKGRVAVGMVFTD
jgi:PilZ domain